jgi:hypothetical protein
MAQRVITTSTRYPSTAKCKRFVAWDFASRTLSRMDLSDFVPEGLNERSQAIYCLVSMRKREPSRRYGVIGSDTRATIKTTNQPGIRIIPYPTGRILD